MKNKIYSFLQESNKIEGYDFLLSRYEEEEEGLIKDSIDAYTYMIENGLDTSEKLCECHGILMRSQDLSYKGEYRKCAVWIGGQQGVKWEDLPQTMEEFFEDFNKIERSPLEYHAIFEVIHPFEDGNGRIGRLLWAYDIIRRGEEIRNFLSDFLGLSFYTKRSFYYNYLQTYRLENKN